MRRGAVFASGAPSRRYLPRRRRQRWHRTDSGVRSFRRCADELFCIERRQQQRGGELELPSALSLVRAHSDRCWISCGNQAGSCTEGRHCRREAVAKEVDLERLRRNRTCWTRMMINGAYFVLQPLRDPRPVRPDHCHDPSRKTETYGSAVAAEYFLAADATMDKEFQAPARPSNAHIMVSSKEAAAAWGTACSISPLGDSLDYSWLDNCAEVWDPRWERPGSRSSPPNGNREAFFWRDEDGMSHFLAEGLRINSGLPEAIRRGHEVLVRSGGFSLGSEARPGGGAVVQDAFVCIPASEDRAVRSALGIPATKRAQYR
ncbi:unnamed protein product [Ectocarpus fasciculatus]